MTCIKQLDFFAYPGRSLILPSCYSRQKNIRASTYQFGDLSFPAVIAHYYVTNSFNRYLYSYRLNTFRLISSDIHSISTVYIFSLGRFPPPTGKASFAHDYLIVRYTPHPRTGTAIHSNYTVYSFYAFIVNYSLFCLLLSTISTFISICLKMQDFHKK